MLSVFSVLFYLFIPKVNSGFVKKRIYRTRKQLGRWKIAGEKFSVCFWAEIWNLLKFSGNSQNLRFILALNLEACLWEELA